MKAAWIRNFWTKTVAFLLAAALVPVILTYVVGLVYSYGGMGRDFYTSDLCLNAVGKKDVGDMRRLYRHGRRKL